MDQAYLDFNDDKKLNIPEFPITYFRFEEKVLAIKVHLHDSKLQ